MSHRDLKIVTILSATQIIDVVPSVTHCSMVLSKSRLFAVVIDGLFNRRTSETSKQCWNKCLQNTNDTSDPAGGSDPT